MNTAMHIKYFRIYTIDLVNDRATLLEGEKETRIDGASEWLLARIRENVCERHREAISELVRADKLAEIFGDKDFYESEFLMERTARRPGCARSSS